LTVRSSADDFLALLEPMDLDLVAKLAPLFG
jgi:hypothetical protein